MRLPRMSWSIVEPNNRNILRATAGRFVCILRREARRRWSVTIYDTLRGSDPEQQQISRNEYNARRLAQEAADDFVQKELGYVG